MNPLISLLGTTESFIPLAKKYFSITLFLALFFIVNNIVVYFVRNVSNSNLSMPSMLVDSLANIVLVYLFIFCQKHLMVILYLSWIRQTILHSEIKIRLFAYLAIVYNTHFELTRIFLFRLFSFQTFYA